MQTSEPEDFESINSSLIEDLTSALSFEFGQIYPFLILFITFVGIVIIYFRWFAKIHELKIFFRGMAFFFVCTFLFLGAFFVTSTEYAESRLQEYNELVSQRSSFDLIPQLKSQLDNLKTRLASLRSEEPLSNESLDTKIESAEALKNDLENNYQLARTMFYVSGKDFAVGQKAYEFATNKSAPDTLRYTIAWAEAIMHDSTLALENAEMVKTRLQNQMDVNKLYADSSLNDYKNTLYVLRAICLGALGALLTLIIATFLKIDEDGKFKPFLDSPRYWSLLSGRIFVGAIVSTIAFALFYTNQLSVFSSSIDLERSGDNNQFADYWRMTIVCLLAGAFADRLYGFASQKMEDITQENPKQEKVAVDSPQDSANTKNQPKNKKPEPSDSDDLDNGGTVSEHGDDKSPKGN